MSDIVNFSFLLYSALVDACIYSIGEKKTDYKGNQGTGKESGVKKMYALLMIVIMWVIGIIGVFAMRKIEPDDKMYPVWVLFVVLAFTVFVIFHEWC